jgi:ferredoxin
MTVYFFMVSLVPYLKKSAKEVFMARTVVIDEEECIGCGTCEEICPEVFKLNEETDKAEVINQKGTPEDKIEEAVEACPVECIHWEE